MSPDGIFAGISLKDLDLLKAKLLRQRAFDLTVYSSGYVERRVSASLMRRNCSLSEYLELLDREPGEYDKFLDSFTINVTEFFRDPTVWRALEKECLPALLEQKLAANQKTLRIWSAGCSSGEEPYTIAILVNELLERKNEKMMVTLLATDIDDGSLEKARKGIYSKESVKNVTPDFLKKYFVLTVDPKTRMESYAVMEPIKRMLTFKKHHFFNDKPFNFLDIIFCRNAIIYLTTEMKDRLFEIFYNSLSKSGMMVIGKAETLFTHKAQYFFQALDAKEHIFRKAGR